MVQRRKNKAATKPATHYGKHGSKKNRSKIDDGVFAQSPDIQPQ